MAIKQRKLCKVSADLELMVDRAKQATGFLKAISHESLSLDSLHPI